MGRVTLLIIPFVLVACKPEQAKRKERHARTAEVERQRAITNRRVFAADGMCSDKLVERYRRQLRLHGKILGTLEERLADYKTARGRIGQARYYPGQALETAADRLKTTYGFWRDVYLPFQSHYGTFWCMRRDDMRVLSSAELEKGFDVIFETVRHLGPLPPEQHFQMAE